jgi:hypothetical protein
MPDLIVIVDPDYGDRLLEAAQIAPVWIVASSANKSVCKRCWANYPHSDHRQKVAVTSYDAVNAKDRLESLLDIMPQLETHHGHIIEDQFSFPPGFVLEVIGLTLDNNAAAGLKDFGFCSFAESSNGFHARTGGGG